jgi:hypothetical protein
MQAFMIRQQDPANPTASTNGSIAEVWHNKAGNSAVMSLKGQRKIKFDIDTVCETGCWRASGTCDTAAA